MALSRQPTRPGPRRDGRQARGTETSGSGMLMVDAERSESAEQGVESLIDACLAAMNGAPA